MEGPSAAILCRWPWLMVLLRRCKRADADVGVGVDVWMSASATRKRGSRPVARGSVCQIQVVSNHRSGVSRS
jgi:hypothetical protein